MPKKNKEKEKKERKENYLAFVTFKLRKQVAFSVVRASECY